MKTSELIKALSERTHFSQSDIKKVLGALSEIITEQLQAGEEVFLHRSLGTFNVETKADKKPIFKISQALKKAVNL